MMMPGLALLLSLAIFTVPGPKFVANDAPEKAEFSLHRISGADKDGPPVFTSVTREKAGLTLVPVYPLSPGETYEARVTLDGSIIDRLTYQPPALDSKPPRVVKILPDTGTVPANLLKFYLHFDQPMREGREIFDRIHLVDEANKEVESPWRRQELWSDDRKRLTLWIHPGRVKLGVNLRDQLGPVLLPGKRYELVLDASLQAPSGQNLGHPFRHAFTTTEENRTPFDVASWFITPPDTSSSPLIIETPRALDPYLAARYLSIYQLEKKREAIVTWDRSQRKFQAHLKLPWIPGDYRIVIGELLEDLAGNTPVRAFDTDLSIPPSKSSPLIRHFSVK